MAWALLTLLCSFRSIAAATRDVDALGRNLSKLDASARPVGQEAENVDLPARGVFSAEQPLRTEAPPRNFSEALKNASYLDPAFLRNLQMRIVNGEVVTSIVPFLVAFSSSRDGSSDIICGGVLLSQRHILTAAHCHVADKYAIAGFLKTSDRSGAQARYVGTTRTDASKPPKTFSTGMGGEYFGFDLAIAIVEPAFDFSLGLRAVRLPTSRASAVKKGTVYGWGKSRIEDAAQNSQTLMRAHLTIHPTCPDDAGLQFCAGGSADGGRDSCTNDSGGPVMKRDTDIIQGVVSWGNGCGTSPGLNTEVYEYVDFIKKVLMEPPPRLFGFLPYHVRLPLIGIVPTKYVLLTIGCILIGAIILVILSPPRRRSRPSPPPPPPPPPPFFMPPPLAFGARPYDGKNAWHRKHPRTRQDGSKSARQKR